MNPDDLFRDIFAQMASQGGMPPEFAHLFANMANGGGRGFHGGAFPGGGGFSFSFSTMGPGGFHFGSGGPNRMNREEDPRLQNGRFGGPQPQNREPETIQDHVLGLCSWILRNCFMIMLLTNFIGIGPAYWMSALSGMFISDANIAKYDISFEKDPNKVELVIPGFNKTYYAEPNDAIQIQNL